MLCDSIMAITQANQTAIILPSFVFTLVIYVPPIQWELLMTSSNFFRQSLFHFDDETAPKPIDNRVLAPWTSHQALPTEASKRDTRPLPTVPPVEKQSIPRRPSNLLPEHITVKPVELPTVAKEGREGRKKLRSELKLLGMPVQQFLAQRREERELEEAMHRRSIELINESLESSFLARRVRKRGSPAHSRTIDLQRDLLQPLQIYRSQQVVDIAPERRRREVGSSLGKYLPIRHDRYQL